MTPGQQSGYPAILEHHPGGRRRLTNDAAVARELAEEIVDYVWEYDGEATRPKEK